MQYLNNLQKLVDDKKYNSRSQEIRIALKDFLPSELINFQKLNQLKYEAK